MNVFCVDRDPKYAARALCDQHAVKMPLEQCQMFSMVLDNNMKEQYRSDKPSKTLGSPGYPPNHVKHPCTKWMMESRGNYRWAVKHLREMFLEYTRRFGKRHKLEGLVMVYEAQEQYLEFDKEQQTEFVQAITDKSLHNQDPVIAYRNYYNIEKSRFARWKMGNVPEWYTPGKLVTS